MAIYHLTAKVVSRGKGQSAVAKAAYNARDKLTNQKTGERHDYRHKDGLEFSGLYLPKYAPDWANNREQLWSEAEKAEIKGKATLAREYEIALPHELDAEQRRRLVQDFVRENFTRKGYAADVNIHAPDKEGDQRNYHAHILVTDRKLTENGFAKTKYERQGKAHERRAELEGLRESWEKLGNRHLERAGYSPTLDRRTLKAQGIGREAGQHMGPYATALERRGIPSELGDVNRGIQASNFERIEAAKLDQQLRDVQAEIVGELTRQHEEQKKERRHDLKTAFEKSAEQTTQTPERQNAAPSVQERADEAVARFTARQEAKQERKRETAPSRDHPARVLPSTRELEQVADGIERGAGAVLHTASRAADGLATIADGFMSAAADFLVGATPSKRPEGDFTSREVRQYYVEQTRAKDRRDAALTRLAEQTQKGQDLSKVQTGEFKYLLPGDLQSIKDRGEQALVDLILRHEREQAKKRDEELGRRRER